MVGHALWRLQVSAAGISRAGITRDLIQGVGTDFRYDSGRLFTASGRVIDPEAGVFLARFPALPDFNDLPGNTQYYNNLVRPDVAAGRVYFLAGDGVYRTLRAYDPVHFHLLGEQQLPHVHGFPSRLLRWGDDGLAFRTDASQLFLIRSALQAPTDLLRVEPAAVIGGNPVTGTITLPERPERAHERPVPSLDHRHGLLNRFGFRHPGATSAPSPWQAAADDTPDERALHVVGGEDSGDRASGRYATRARAREVPCGVAQSLLDEGETRRCGELW